MKKLFAIASIFFFIACSDNNSDKVSYCLVSDAEGKSIICTKATGEEEYTQSACDNDAQDFDETTSRLVTECPSEGVLETCKDSNDDMGMEWEVSAYNAAGVKYCSDF